MIVSSEFKPAWWMRNRHLQTILPRFYPARYFFSPVDSEFELSDGDFVEITWSVDPSTMSPNQPVVLVLHGLEGSFDSFYAKRMMNKIHQQGWVAVLMHFRGCGKKPNRKAQSYHSGQTSDVTEFVEHLKQNFPNHPLFAVGFSLGGNVLAKYLGEQPESGIDGAVVISAPLDLSICAKAIGSGFSKVYQKYLVDRLKNSTHEKIDFLQGAEPIPLDKQVLDTIKTLPEFDQLLTAPINGFDSAEDYYQRCSGNQFLKSITTPTLIIHAKDDPFMTEAVIPDNEMMSSTVQFELSERGGHVGFLSGWNPLNPEFWLETRASQYIQQRLAR